MNENETPTEVMERQIEEQNHLIYIPVMITLIAGSENDIPENHRAYGNMAFLTPEQLKELDIHIKSLNTAINGFIETNKTVE